MHLLQTYIYAIKTHHTPTKFMLPLNLFLHLYLLLLLLTFCLKSGSSFSHKIPRLSPNNRYKAALNLRNTDKSFSESANILEDYKTYYYDQTLDHFNYGPESYATFKQRYVINFKHWGGSNSSSPILAYFGAEESLDIDLNSTGFINDAAPDFKALSVYIEHRFYGNSIPFGTLEEALENETLRGYFSSAQAIADYAEVLLHVKENFSAHNSPIIVVGGSYGGALASWFRLKYPHIAIGALASSAPILYFDDIIPQNGYYSIVTNDFKEVSETCFQTIRDSWSEIERVASTRNGLSILSQKFKTCSRLSNYYDLEDFLQLMYASAAQYNDPASNPVARICGEIDGAQEGTDILGRIFAGVVSYEGNQPCYVNSDRSTNQTSTEWAGWQWQTCSEMVVPIGIDNDTLMFPPSPFNLTQYTEHCKGLFGVPPRPHWVTTYYGGHDIKLVLQRFGSNIIFSNGLRDPYSSGGFSLFGPTVWKHDRSRLAGAATKNRNQDNGRMDRSILYRHGGNQGGARLGFNPIVPSLDLLSYGFCSNFHFYVFHLTLRITTQYLSSNTNSNVKENWLDTFKNLH